MNSRKTRTEQRTGGIIDSLCSLLIPFLDHQRRVTDGDRQSVLDVLKRIITRVPSESAVVHFESLSSLLGPCKAKRLDFVKRSKILIGAGS